MLGQVCVPVIDGVPGHNGFVHHLLDPACVVGGVIMQKLIAQLIKRRHGHVLSAQVLQEGLDRRKGGLRDTHTHTVLNR